MAEEMDIDDYSRDRSRSPVRNRSRSTERRPYGGRESSYRGGRDFESRGGGRRPYSDRGYSDRGYGGRGGYRSDRGGRDYRRGPPPPARFDSGGDYRSKIDRNYDNSIFIGNIGYDCSPADVERHFESIGKVLRADIVTNRGISRGMATVEFANKEDVRNAISQFDHSDFMGREIFVRQDHPPPADRRNERFEDRRYERREQRFPPRERAPPPPPGTEIFVGNLPFSVNWQALKDIMREAGEVVRADVREDERGRSKGFGTVVFSSVDEAKKALEIFSGREIEGRRIDVREGRVNQDSGSSYERPPIKKNSEFTEGVTGEGPSGITIYVNNLPWSTADDDLVELFETIGHVEKAEIQYNESGRPSGAGVVKFDSEEVAATSIEKLDGYAYGGRNLKITYATLP